jgi:putative hemolysin
MNIIIEIAVILLLLVANGAFALSEIAVVSSRKARLQQRRDEGEAGARAALQLANDPGRFLATVQIGITLVGILAGTFGGATVARQLAAWFADVPALAGVSNALALTIVVLVITYLSLIIGELVPKRIALSDPESMAIAVAKPMRTLSNLARPAVWGLEKSSAAVLKLIGFRAPAEQPVSEEEIKLLIHQGAEAGVFQEAEEQMVKGVFRLADRRVEALMTPRTEIDWLNLSDSSEALQARIHASPRSRFPVARGSLDNVVGLAEAKKMLGTCITGSLVSLEDVIEPAIYVPESLPALVLLEKFKAGAASRTALVIDEYGIISGLVTPYDIVEAIVGELPDLGAPDEPMALRRADGTWLIDGMMPLDEFKDKLGARQLPNEERGFYSTVAGYLVAQLGHVPVATELFEADNWRFEVMDMDGHRIDKVLVTPPREDLAIEP